MRLAGSVPHDGWEKMRISGEHFHPALAESTVALFFFD